MNIFANVDLSNATDHGVLAEPWTYEVTRVCFAAARNGALDGTLDLALTRDSESVKLRFLDQVDQFGGSYG